MERNRGKETTTTRNHQMLLESNDTHFNKQVTGITAANHHNGCVHSPPQTPLHTHIHIHTRTNERVKRYKRQNCSKKHSNATKTSGRYTSPPQGRRHQNAMLHGAIKQRKVTGRERKSLENATPRMSRALSRAKVVEEQQTLTFATTKAIEKTYNDRLNTIQYSRQGLGKDEEKVKRSEGRKMHTHPLHPKKL
uniref:Uncharacterized protein TCIL3000_1_550 n=1 Tax=Trypanosoma congolense (strain IL3000) TaxID=1068625 RepID=G0UIU7_TRYCI|nr:unnamed protein product [Trypanosoma congolense IL3000]